MRAPLAQEYDAKLHRIYQEGVGFVSYDVK